MVGGWLARRAKEPSTAAGLAVLVQVVKVMAPAWVGVADAVTGLLIALAVALPEGRK